MAFLVYVLLAIITACVLIGVIVAESAKTWNDDTDDEL